MASGDFGRMDARVRPKSRRKESVALRLLRRELGVDGTPEKVGNNLLAQVRGMKAPSKPRAVGRLTDLFRR